MTDNRNQQGDFISLATFSDTIRDFFTIFFRATDYLIAAIRRYIVLFLLCLAVGGLLGYLNYVRRPVVYVSDMIVQQNLLTKGTFNEITVNLNRLAASGLSGQLASELGMSPGLAAQIASVQVLSISDEPPGRDTSTRTGGPFKVQAHFTDTGAARPFQEALVRYYNNNGAVRFATGIQKQIFLEKLGFIQKEQAKLDTLKDNLNQLIGSGRAPAGTYSQAVDPAPVYIHSLNLELQRESIANWLGSNGSGILVIDGFKTPVQVAVRPAWYSIGAGLLGGLLVGTLLVFVGFLRNRVR